MSISSPPPEHSPADRFTIVRQVGQGGMGIVYEAIDRQRGQRVALKKLRWLQPLNLYRFKREFRSLAEVVHPNLVLLYELIAQGEDWYYTMEFVDGAHFVAAHRAACDGACDERRLRRCLWQLVEGVAALHHCGKLHRDLKPQNVLVTDEDRVVVLDFGLIAELQPGHEDAAAERGAGLTAPRGSSWGHPTTDYSILGTAEYMAPEQAQGHALSPASDWYAVGAMLYEVLTGQPPFVGESLRILMDKQVRQPTLPDHLLSRIAPDLGGLCLDLLRPDPAARPTGDEILRRLEASPAGRSAPALPSAVVWAEPAEVPFVGRGQQLAAMEAALTDVLDGWPTTLHVVGRSGVGKTALVGRFVSDVRLRYGTVVLSGRCHPEESVPFKALDSLIDSLSRFLLRLPGAEADAYMPRDIAALARVFPVLRRVDAVAESPARLVEIPNVQELRRRAFGALREMLARIGDRRPLVLWVDDLQWGDTDSVAAFAELLRQPDPPRLLLVFSYRSEDETVASCLQTLAQVERGLGASGRRHEVRLPELTPPEATELADQLLRRQNRPGSAELAARISRESRGSPLFVFELTRAAISDSGSGADAVQRLDLDHVLWSRVSELPDRARRLLEFAAVAGQPIRVRHVLEAAGLDAHDQQAVHRLRTAHFLRGTGFGPADEIETYHDRIRETIIGRLSAEALQERHRRLALVLEAGGQADPVQLAVHYRGAAQPQRAAHYFLLAGDRAASALAFERAADHYREALALDPGDAETRRRTLVNLGDALANAGRGAEAAAVYLEAGATAPRAQARELARRAAFQYCISGYLSEGRAAFRQVLAEIGMRLPETPLATLTALLYFRTRLRLRGLRFRPRDPAELPDRDRVRLDITESVAMGSSTNHPWLGALFQVRNLLLALSSGDPVRIALAMSWEAAYRSLSGGRGWRRTARLLELAGTLAEQARVPHALGSSSLVRGTAEFLSGRYQTGLESCQRAEQIFRDRCTGVTWELDTALVFGVWSLFYMGRIDTVRGRYSSIFQEALERGDRYLITTLGTQVGSVLSLADDQPQLARELLDDIMSRWIPEAFTVQHLHEFFGRQAIDLYAGDVTSLLPRMEEVERRCRGALLLRIQHIRIDLCQLRARCYLAAARRDSAGRSGWLRRVAKCVLGLRRERMPFGLALAAFLEANASLAAGDTASASGGLAQAAEQLERTGQVLLARVADAQRGQLVGGEEGRSLTAAAAAWLQDQGVRNPENFMRMLSPLA